MANGEGIDVLNPSRTLCVYTIRLALKLARGAYHVGGVDGDAYDLLMVGGTAGVAGVAVTPWAAVFELHPGRAVSRNYHTDYDANATWAANWVQAEINRLGRAFGRHVRLSGNTLSQLRAIYGSSAAVEVIPALIAGRA